MKKIAVVGGGPFGLFATLRLGQNKDNHVTLFEGTDRLGGLAASERYKDHYLDYNTKVIPCNAFGRPGLDPTLQYYLNRSDALLDEIGDYYFLDNGQYKFEPPPLHGFSKLKVFREALRVLKHFPQIDHFGNMFDLEQNTVFARDESLQALGERLGLSSFTRLVAYFGNIFGMSTEGAEAVSVVTSRNSFVTYNYLNSIFKKNNLTERLLSLCDPNDLLNRQSSIPFKFVMFTTGYDRFLQSLPLQQENIEVRLKHLIKDLDQKLEGSSAKFVLIGEHDVFSSFDEVVLALPKNQIKKFKYKYVSDLMAPIHTDSYFHVLTSFCQADRLQYLKKGVYLDANNPNGIGLPTRVRDGSVYGTFKHFHADSMFEMLSMIDDIDPEQVNEAFIHHKSYQVLKELGFDVLPEEVKPYGWKMTKWNTPFAQIGDFDYYERLQQEQGKHGIWFGGEMMSGPGVPTIIRYIESLFGPFDLQS